MFNLIHQASYRYSDREVIKGNSRKCLTNCFIDHVKITQSVLFFTLFLLLHSNAVLGWSVNAQGLFQTGLPDAFSAATLGCQHTSKTTRIAGVDFIPPGYAFVACHSFDVSTAQWYWWREAFIALEPGDIGYFMDAGDFNNEDQGAAECSSKHPINLINGNKYKIYTDIDDRLPAGINRPGFRRNYNSLSQGKVTTIGNKWTHTYDRRMQRINALRTAGNVKFASGGNKSKPSQSDLYPTRESACESGIMDIKVQAQGLGSGPFTYLKAFQNADAKWVDEECRIYVDGRYRANFPIYSHSTSLVFDSSWDNYLHFHRQDGNVIRFQKSYSGSAMNKVLTWEEVSDAGYRLDSSDATPVPLNLEVVNYQAIYVLTDPENVKETYDHSGKLLYVDHPNGVHEMLSYQDERLVRVDNSLGHSIEFEYSDDGYIEFLTDESNRTWEYRYFDNNLVEVFNPDSTSIKYHYEDSSYPGALTGVTDERNIRVSTFDYYQDGLARSSYLGQPGALPELRVDNVEMTYGPLSNTLTNSRGFQSTYHFYGSVLKGLLTQYDGPECVDCGGSTSYDYDIDLQLPKDSSFNLLGKTEYGQITVFENHDDQGYPGTVIEAVATPEERTTIYTYDPRYHGKVASKTEPSVYAGKSKVTTYTYDDFGNTTKITVDGYKPDGTPVSRSHSFVYNGPLHQLSEIDGPLSGINDVYSFSYYPDHSVEGSNRAMMKALTTPLGVVLYDNISYTSSGKRASYTTGSNLQADFTYYPGNDRLETQTLTDLSSGDVRTTRWTYIATGEVESITQGYATPEATTLTFEYDDARRLTKVYDGFSNYIEYVLDTEGNVVNENIHDQSGVLQKTLNRSFDASNRLDISAQVNETRNLDFSPDGTLDLETNGKNVVTDYSYDALRRLTSVTQDAGGAEPSSANALTQLGYDVQDNLVSVTDPNGGQTSYVYDDLGNLISLTSPDTGMSNYMYDEAGNIASMTDAKGQVFSYSYDAMGRIMLSDAPGTQDDVTYVYDSCENGMGKLCTVTRNTVTVDYGYTAFGDTKLITQTVATYSPYEQAVAQTSYNYDALGRIKDIVYPGGSKVTYTYDPAGNVYSVILNDGEKNLVTSSQYYPFGPERLVSRDNGSSIFGFMDQAYRTFITGHGGYFYDVIYYDANGNPETFYSSEGSKMYVYDTLDRLNTSSGPLGSRDYSYDINGNRVSKTSDIMTDNYSYDESTNRMNTNAGSAVTLDANGNTTSIGSMSISYTTDNRVSSISGLASYMYSGIGERAMKAVRAPGLAGTYGYNLNTVYVYGLGGKLLAEMGSSGKVKQEYIYLNDKLLTTIVYKPDDGEPILNADMDNDGAIGVDDFLVWFFNHYNVGDVSREVSGDGLLDMNDFNLVLNCAMTGGTSAGCSTASYNRSIYYAHNDHLGTPHMLSDESGAAVWSAVYNSFGKAVVNEDRDGDGDNVTLNIRFPGQYYDTESGLHYNYFRYYDPETGRYIRSDPIGLAGGVNTYTYVLSNPMSYTDPLGLDVMVCNFGGMHVGIGVNTNNTDGRRPNNVLDLFPNPTKDVPGEVSKDKGSRQCTNIQTSYNEDKLVQAYINKNINNPGNYNLTQRNCVGFVRGALNNILNMNINNTIYPVSLYNQVRLQTGAARQTRRGLR